MRRGGSQQRCFFHITDKHEAISPFNLLTFQAPILNHPLDTSGRVGLALSFIVLQVFNKALSCTSCLLSVKSAADYNRWQKKREAQIRFPFIGHLHYTIPIHYLPVNVTLEKSALFYGLNLVCVESTEVLEIKAITSFCQLRSLSSICGRGY